MLIDDEDEDDVYDERAHMLAGENYETTLLPSLKSQHELTKSEIIQGMANRFMYSQFYIVLYLGLAILSFVTILMSLEEKCPSILFIVFESTINFAMIVEVITRLLALGSKYWKSIWNIMDLILVTLCAITLIVLTTGCSVSEQTEALLDTVVLAVRNGFQLFRLFIMVRKNQYSIHARSTRIDFNNIPDHERDPSLEFTALDHDRSFLDSDLESVL